MRLLDVEGMEWEGTGGWAWLYITGGPEIHTYSMRKHEA